MMLEKTSKDMMSGIAEKMILEEKITEKKIKEEKNDAI